MNRPWLNDGVTIESLGAKAGPPYRREFCTLFDSNYLLRALAMYRSLERHCPSFRLTAFCFDEEAQRILEALALPHLDTVSLAELESFDADLLAVKDDRNPVEYCWTSTPALPLYMFDARPEIEEITYLDADLMFFADPEPLFEEMGDASVAITPHRFPPEYGAGRVNGIYNVQFLPFRRDLRGLQVLNWWHDRCIEWCYNRLEDGKIGDQGYLDDWPTRFEGVHVLQHKGGGLAPWNVGRYKLRRSAHRITVDGEPLLFYHYYKVELRSRGPHEWRPPVYVLSRRTKRLIYRPYFEAIRAATEEVRAVEPGFSAGLVDPPPLAQRVSREAKRTARWAEIRRYELKTAITSRAAAVRDRDRE
jgi:hypothetical protein